MATEPTEPKQHERSPDFVHRYANHVAFELNALDVRMVFGTTEKDAPTSQHTAITMTWAEAKILHHYLSGNLMIYEGLEGKIRIPSGAIPPPPPSLKEGASPERIAVANALRKLYDEFVAEQA